MARREKSLTTDGSTNRAVNAGDEDPVIIEDDERKKLRERYLADGLDPSCYGL